MQFRNQKLTLCLLATLVMAIMTAAPAEAKKAAAAPAKKEWRVRMRALAVMPENDSTTSINGKVEPSNVIVPELDISYFWNDHWATELILATTPHDVKAYNTNLGNLDLGEVWLLPPTLTLQYHFQPAEKFQPYVGAGVNYTLFYHQNAGPSIASIDYDNSFGLAGQAGFDYMIDDSLFFNMDIKKVWINTDVSINGGGVTANVDIDPLLFGIGFGYRF